MLALHPDLVGQSEERQLLTDLFHRYHDKMGRVALAILHDQSRAEDAVQSAFEQIIRHLEKISQIPCEKQGAYIITIVKNEALTLLRKEKRALAFEDWDSVEQSAEDVTGYRDLVDLFRQLPDTYRAALEMKLLRGCSDGEIAKKLGITETAVSTRISRGRALLRQIVEKEGYHP